MDKQARKSANDSLFLVLALITIVLTMDWLYRSRLLSASMSDIYKPVFSLFKPYLLPIRSLHLVLVALLGYVNMQVDFKGTYNKLFLYALAFFLSIGLLLGYSHTLWYNMYLYPVIFLGATFSLLKAIQYSKAKTHKDDDTLALVSSTAITDTTFTINTDKGQLGIPNAEHGIYIEAGPGGGKTVLIDNLLYQAVNKDFAVLVYDFEGNPEETDETQGVEGTILSRTVYTTLKIRTKQGKTKFAFLNFNDLSRTVRCNPYSKKYIDSDLDIIELANTLMKNLEKEWVTKTDFWASNAINVVTGCHMALHRYHPDICDIPHLIALILSDFRALLGFLASYPDLKTWVLPVLSAFEQEAHQQTAGVISTSQLPLTKLYIPEIFWVLSPPADQEFDLDITNKKNPTSLCLGNNGIKQNAALGPVIALIISICTKNMNRFGKHKGFLCIDEGDTIYLPNIDLVPATIRKKGVITLFAVQTFNQTIDKYGERGAKKLRDNLNNQFLGKTNNLESAERMVKMFGEYRKTEFSESQGDSGDSQTKSVRNEKLLQIPDVALQQTGHFTGYISNSPTPKFHAQCEYFSMEKMILPRFSLPVNTGDLDGDLKVLKEMVTQNFQKIRSDIDTLLLPFKPQDTTIDE